jgi:AraC family transcriptional regulator
MPKKSPPQTYFIQVVNRPARKLILKRGVKAYHYFEFLQEVGANTNDELKKIKGNLYEPCGMWLPKNLRKPGTSEFVMGVEMPASFKGKVPKGFEIISLKPCKMMVFQGPPFGDILESAKAIMKLWAVLETFKPETYGYAFADEDGPRLQLEPQPQRGHIELLPVRQLKNKTKSTYL